MLEKLFYNDSFLSSFSATVTNCTIEKDHFSIVLDKTVFYPESGGQPSDKGTLSFNDTNAEIFFVKEKNGVICHYSYTQIPVGTTVFGQIDFQRRFDLMQQHTGEHIVSGIVNSLFGYDNVGFHLTENNMSIDFSGVLSNEDLLKVIDMSNDIILKNQPVAASYPDTTNLEYRSKKILEGPIRIVEAGKADRCACCGTHVKTTGQVQIIAVKDSMNYKGGTRVFLGCGNRVYKDYLAKNAECYKISHLLSCKIGDVSQKVNDKIKECDNLKTQLSNAKQELFSLWAENIHGDIGYIEKDNLSSSEIQKLADAINKNCPVSVVLSHQENESYKICIISKTQDTNKLGKAICNAFGGKGGGKNGIFQGTLNSYGDIKSVLEENINAD